MLRAASKGRSTGGFIIASALLLSVALVGPADAQDTDGLIPEGDWTDEQVQEMLDLIERTETELPEHFPASGPRSEIEAELVDRGYFNFGISAPGGYWHMINPAFAADNNDLVNPATAESLVYQDDGTGNWELVSAMYMAGPDDTVDDLPHDVAWLPGWHGHPELCTTADTAAGIGRFVSIINPDDPNDECPPGSAAAVTPVMMHVWLVDNGECDHRFGGIGVGGVHCDVHGHPGGGQDDPPSTTPPGNGQDDPPSTTPPGNGQDDPPGTTPPTTDPPGNGHDDPPGTTPPGDNGNGGGTPPPAQPVTGTPSFTG